MATSTERRIPLLVLALVGAGFTTLYLTQPVLPVLQVEFGVDEARASMTVTAIVLVMPLTTGPAEMLAGGGLRTGEGQR